MYFQGVNLNMLGSCVAEFRKDLLHELTPYQQETGQSGLGLGNCLGLSGCPSICLWAVDWEFKASETCSGVKAVAFSFKRLPVF